MSNFKRPLCPFCVIRYFEKSILQTTIEPVNCFRCKRQSKLVALWYKQRTKNKYPKKLKSKVNYNTHPFINLT